MRAALVLTEQGERCLDTASEVMNKLHTAETLLSRCDDEADRRTAPDLRLSGLGTVWVTQRMPEFMELYPDIRIELMLNDDEQIDIAMREADARCGCMSRSRAI